jgi:antitoxin (DNA-binding transcriptional repressor) of toxin-antitoxin stability system
MKTISAKELRNNLDAILERVNAGEDIVIKHRFKEPVKLSALHPPKNKADKQHLPGLAAFEAAPKKPVSFDPKKSVKEIYHELLDKEYGL